MHDDPVSSFARDMQRRWEQRARVDHRYFTESMNFGDEAAWDEQADREVAMYLHDLDPGWLAAGPCLEIGCGPGRILSRLASHVGAAVGIDISPTMLRHAREVCPSHVLLVQTSGLDLGFLASERFHLVVMHSVAIHLPRPLIQHYVHESFRVLVPGGHLRFTAYRNPSREDVESQQELIEDVGSRIPEGVGDLVYGPDYVGHAFEDDDLDALVRESPFAGRRIERFSPFLYGVDLWRE